MATFSKSAVIDAPADDVWRVVRDFNNTQKFSPAVATSVLETGEHGPGALRTITMTNGAKALDRLDILDDRNRVIVYSILESEPLFPFKGYQATMRITPLDSRQCRLDWSCFFLTRGGPEQDSIDIIDAVYTGAIAGLQSLFKGASG